MSRTDKKALPYHWISLKTSGTIFLDRIEKIVKNNSVIMPERVKESWLDRLFMPVRNSRHYKNLQIDVSVESKRSKLVRIDARADWEKDPPSPELYDEVVTKYFIPYLETYNQLHKTTLQLEKGKLYTGRPDLPTEATTLLKRFIALSLHKYKPPKWESLYPFIHHCHGYKIKLSTSELIHFLQEAGFSEESSKQIAKVYAHGRNVLSFYKPTRTFFSVDFD